MRASSGTLFFLAMFSTLSLSAVERHIWVERYSFAPGGTVGVENTYGSIAVEGWDQAEVQVMVIKTPSGDNDADLDHVRVAGEQGVGTLTFRTIYIETPEKPVKVDYRIRVPRQTHLRGLKTAQGRISVRDVEGDVYAYTLDGNIEYLNVSGRVVARTVNGDINVALRALVPSAEAYSLETLSGHIALLLPPGTDADLEIETVSGRILTPYAVAEQTETQAKSFRARVGKGGDRIQLRTVKGNIRVQEMEPLL